MRLNCLLWASALLLSRTLSGQCLTFPASLIPLSAVSYVTAANSAGDQLVVGSLAGGLNTLGQLPLPDSTNETYCDSSVQLAAGQFYSNVYVPSAQERSGNFSAFAGLLVNPANGQPFAGGMIPGSLLGQVYAFRIGAVQTSQSVRGWSSTGSSPYPLLATNASVVVLPSGKVFIPGSTALIYDPSTGVFTSGSSPLVQGGGASILLDNGQVLIVGGSAPSGAELYDPVSGNITALPNMIQAHNGFFTATKLNDGRVLIAGGTILPQDPSPTAQDDVPSGAELFDPKTMTFSAAGPMITKRFRHLATLLPGGRVLIAGGQIDAGSLNSTEIYDPTTNRFSASGFLNVARTTSTAALLPNGKVLIAGGFVDTSAELYDPVTGTSLLTGSMASNHANGRIAVLGNGQVLVFTGRDCTIGTGCPLTPAAELYSPASGTFSATGSMTAGRLGAAAALLPDGRVFAAGGQATADNVLVDLSSAEIYTPTLQGLVVSKTGITFRAAQGSAAVTPQSLLVLSPTDDIPWTVSVKTYSGGNWLSATPSSSQSTPGAAPVTLTVNVDPTGLAAQDYYGAVTLTPTDQKHPPVTVAIVFSIVPAGTSAPLQVAPTGLVFLTSAGTSPKPQSFSVTNFTSRAVNFTAASSATFFTFSPAGGTITTTLPGVITVTPSADNLTSGVYRGSIKLSFNDGSTQTVDVLLVVSPAPAAGASVAPQSVEARGREATAACVPSKLLPVLISIAAGSTAPIAWPASLQVQVVDDCGSQMNAGNVVASFTNGDPPFSLIGVGGGAWSGTWVPVHTSTNVTIRVDARTPQPALSGTVQVALQVASNPKVPVVASGGVLSSGDYTSPPAAGLLVSIFGSALADGSASFSQVPLTTQIGSTEVLLGGKELPLVYVSENQVNVLVPYDTPLNVPLGLLVTRANAISVPVTVAVFDAQPAILSTAGNGLGQGHIYKATSAGAQILADAASPATAGDVLVMYCVGLGAVTPSVQSGDASPSNPLAKVAAPVTVTIGGQTAQPFFAGLTPGFVGLYQVNVVMPAGVAPGGQTPVTVSVGAKSSSPGITMAAK